MANVKNPLLSLDARGSISDAISFTKRRSQNIVEKKPVLPYFLTLPVQYQRWLYEDYAHLWTQQTTAVKQVYATAGTRHHLTGFQYWIKYQLTNLPDLAGYWKLDDVAGPATPDSSRNTNTGTIIGASPTTGVIDRCLFFDGVNDYVNFGNHSSLDVSQALTLDFFLYLSGPGTGAAPCIIAKGWDIAYELYLVIAGTKIECRFDGSVGMSWANTPITSLIWHHVAVTYLSGVGCALYLDGQLKSIGINAGNIDINTKPLLIARYRPVIATHFLHGFVDNLFLYNRALDPADILRHSKRRWP